MNLLDEIEAAQRKAQISYDTFGGRGCQKVLDAMTPAARQAWRETNMPDQLLVSSRLSEISRYAQHCGITLPQDEAALTSARES
jgi:hypothetical protein